MKISLRFLYAIPILSILFTDRAFTEFLFPEEGNPLAVKYTLGLLGCSLAGAVLLHRSMEPLMRRWLLLLLAALGGLALESYAGWGTWMVYNHVFSKLLVLLHVFALYAFYRRFGLPPFGLLMAVLLLGLGANLVLYHPEALSLSGFLANERGFGSNSAMLLLLPTLYYFNQYLTRGGLVRLLLAFGGMAFIIFLQHRSVWLALGMALALNVLLVAFDRLEGARLSTQRLLPMVLLPFIVLVSGGMVVLTDPKISRKLENSVNNILHPEKGGTGGWRLQQFESYKPFLLEYPIAGMRLKGFELPVQFYTIGDDGASDAKTWSDMTGHHFHSFYVDRLFYFGILGLLLTVLAPLVVLARRIRQPEPLPAPTAALVLFCLSTFIYSISYDWPLYFFGVWGLALAAATVPFRRPVPVAAAPRSVAALPAPLLRSSSASAPAPSYAHPTAATARR
ncbi:O-antigen ligase [Hymenobacter daecheongensis DSM 21074]|uniref:O-antigen ligase n=1 Tax=Hymenobacter daecheongensis DSM 21074 TaxID=1121955 RepID=A0A1M6KJN4_9BACT|nr:O-antigen ligase family protein [Hymenobacter daecheongensis]SHJ59041.1 O-antigen ligase [Hymenobacter daecheongensis DSM 21074]